MAADPEGSEQEEKLEYWKSGAVEMVYNKDAGTQMIQHQDSVTDYCSISSQFSLEPPGSDSPSASEVGSPVSRSSVSLSTDQQDGDGRPNQTGLAAQEPQQDPDGTDQTPSAQLQALTVLSVNRTLWIPRYTTQRNATQHNSFKVGSFSFVGVWVCVCLQAWGRRDRHSNAVLFQSAEGTRHCRPPPTELG